MTVLISDFSRYYRLAAYIARYTKAKIGITMGAASLGRVFDEQYYEDLPGGILESFGRLFKNDLKLFVYPCRDRQTGAITTAETLPVCDELKKLLDYLLDRERIVGIDCYDEKCLDIYSRDVLAKIKEGDDSWEEMVPPDVAKVIKERRYFGYEG